MNSTPSDAEDKVHEYEPKQAPPSRLVDLDIKAEHRRKVRAAKEARFTKWGGAAHPNLNQDEGGPVGRMRAILQDSTGESRAVAVHIARLAKANGHDSSQQVVDAFLAMDLWELAGKSKAWRWEQVELRLPYDVGECPI